MGNYSADNALEIMVTEFQRNLNAAFKCGERKANKKAKVELERLRELNNLHFNTAVCEASRSAWLTKQLKRIRANAEEAVRRTFVDIYGETAAEETLNRDDGHHL